MQHAGLDPPGDDDPSPARREGAVLGGVGGEFVDRHADRHGDLGGKIDRRAVEDDAQVRRGLGLALGIGHQLGGEQVAQARRLPRRLGEHAVGVGERLDAADEGLVEIVDAGGGARRRADDGLDRGERVLHPVVQLADEEAAALLGEVAVGHVGDDADQAPRQAARPGPLEPAGHVDGAPLPVVVAADAAGGVEDRVLAQRPQDRLPEDEAVVGVEDLLEEGGLADAALFGAAPEDREHPLVLPGRLVVEDVPLEDAEIGDRGGDPQALLALGQGLPRLDPGGHVLHHADDADRRAVGGEQRLAAGADPDLGAVGGAAEAGLEGVGPALGDGRGDRVLDPLGILRIDLAPHPLPGDGASRRVAENLRRAAREHHLPGDEIPAPLAEARRRQGIAVLLGPDQVVGIDEGHDRDRFRRILAGEGQAQIEAAAIGPQPAADAGLHLGASLAEGFAADHLIGRAAVEGARRVAEPAAQAGVGGADPAPVGREHGKAHRRAVEGRTVQGGRQVRRSRTLVRAVVHSVPRSAARRGCKRDRPERGTMTEAAADDKMPPPQGKPHRPPRVNRPGRAAASIRPARITAPASRAEPFIRARPRRTGRFTVSAAASTASDAARPWCLSA
ncbi:hypothetical protein CHKEEEPN_4962 [Methylorubrum podarium]|nr:hypothetical protein CHKEEEPN_4962 [Methylorubrum podarium]